MLLTFSNVLDLEHSNPLHPTDILLSSLSSLQHTHVQTYIPGWKCCIYPENISTLMTGSLFTLQGELYVFFVPLFLRVNRFIQALQTSLLCPAHLLAQLVVWQKAVAFSAWKGQPAGTHLHFPLGGWGLCLLAARHGDEQGQMHFIRLCGLPGSDQRLSFFFLPEENCLLLFCLSWAWKLIGVFISWNHRNNEQFPTKVYLWTTCISRHMLIIAQLSELLTSVPVSARERQRGWEAVNVTHLPWLVICRYE